MALQCCNQAYTCHIHPCPPPTTCGASASTHLRQPTTSPLHISQAASPTCCPSHPPYTPPASNRAPSCCPSPAERYYYYFNTGLQSQYTLMTQGNLGEEGSVLLDPNTFSEDGTVALRSISFSEDGKMLAYAVSSGGSDWSTIKVGGAVGGGGGAGRVGRWPWWGL
jgi:hypothetical protein